MRTSVFHRGVFAAMFMMVVASASIRASSAAAIEYSLSPQRTVIAPGQQCTLSVMAGVAGDSLGCVELRVSFDPTLVTLLSGGEGTLFTNSGVPRLFFNSPVAPDTFSVEGCLLGYRTYTLTPGQVARFVFRADAEGVCPVRITRLSLWDIDRVMFNPSFEASAWIFIGSPTGVRPQSPPGLDLLIHPNPFGSVTTIDLVASPGERTRVGVYTADGRLVTRLFDAAVSSGGARLQWNGRNTDGARMPSGVYFVNAVSGDSRATRKVVITR